MEPWTAPQPTNRKARRRYQAIARRLCAKLPGDSNPARRLPLHGLNIPDNRLSHQTRRALAQSTLTTTLAA